MKTTTVLLATLALATITHAAPIETSKDGVLARRDPGWSSEPHKPQDDKGPTNKPHKPQDDKGPTNSDIGWASEPINPLDFHW
ncbi:hypothetical protein FBU30_006047 [Linnemannia zychae]|nr:hypothetical protein FBU30_006047 [Linnemannia zychae]